MQNPAVENVVTIAGLRPAFRRAEDQCGRLLRLPEGLVASAPTRGSTRAIWRRPSRRSTPTSATAIVIGFNPPPIQGLSTTGGFEFYLQDRSGGSLESLAAGHAA